MVRGVRSGAGRRRGKRERPEGGDSGGLTPPPVAAGADADQIIDEARRRTTSRRELAGKASFDEISPDVGQLDEAAFAEAMADDPDEAVSLLAEMTSATDADLRALARRLAGRLFIDLARAEVPDSPGVGRVTTQPYRPDRGDLDVEASAEALVEARAARRLVDPEALRVRAWARPSTAWCLLVDRSGSMHGAPLATAALAAAAVAIRAERDYAVLSFGREIVAPKAMWETRGADDVVDRVLALRGHGTTDVAGALLAAGDQLRATAAARRVTVLLSDCRATEPGDVVAAARSLDELLIVAPAGDAVEAGALADSVGAAWTTIDGPSSIAAAFAELLDR